MFNESAIFLICLMNLLYFYMFNESAIFLICLMNLLYFDMFNESGRRPVVLIF